MSTNLLKNLPSVTELLESPQFKAVRDRVSHSVIVARARTYLDDLRAQVQSTATEVVIPTFNDLAQRLAQRILQAEQSRLRPVINATGALLPEGMGGPPLAPSAVEAMAAVATDYASLELDLETGQHSPRSRAIEELLTELTGAEAALAVNSSSAATMLVLAALATGREVVVARSQLLELSDGFRLSDAIAASGAILREVGAVNSARIDDYRQAVHEQTSAVLLVETSAAMPGGRPSLEELVSLAQSQGVPLIHDVGAGALMDLAPLGLGPAVQLSESVRAAADLVISSGDKLGGPQCGLLLGKRALIQQISLHPWARAVQGDRAMLAALAATLRLYRQPELARDTIPLLQLSTTSVENLQNRAQRIAPQLAACGALAAADAVACTAAGQVAGSWCIQLTPAAGRSVTKLAAALRSASPPVIAREEADRLVFDLRTVFPRQDQQLVDAVAALTKDKS